MEKLGTRMKLLLFFSAYFPLFLILCVKNNTIFANVGLYWQTKTFWMLLIPLFLSVISSFIFVMFFLFQFNKSSDDEFELLSYADTAPQSISYILTYIIPFLDFNLGNRFDILCIYILLFIIGLIYVNTDMIYTNPLLYALGYNAFDVELKDSEGDESKAILVVKNKQKFTIFTGDMINTSLINNNYKNLLLFKSKTEKD